jgi:hypothetical protein
MYLQKIPYLIEIGKTKVGTTSDRSPSH